MNTVVIPPSRCPICGKTIPLAGLSGLCPACLLAQGAETKPADPLAGNGFQPPALADIAKLFPQLTLLKLLGAGGMGAVYQARQPSLDRLVALKVLPFGGGTGSSERFNREARALARLSHPNIVAVHEFGQAGGLHYFIMEYVDGANLRQLEKTSRLSPREALQIIPQICDALQYAHDEGVVHRDIKPENVLVDRKGRVKIADFGLAKIADPNPEAARLTAEGQVMGTPHYMAPEQVERPLAVDHRADIYALGVVFYEMLTGDLPLGKFAPPSRKVHVDVRLDDIVLRALENDPERRYQQASEIKQGVATVCESSAGSASALSVAPPSAEGATASGERFLHWLNIPVVVERTGVREVSFQGAMAALFVVMMTAAAAHMFVRWADGREHALSNLVVLFGLVVLVLGIRQAMNRPVTDEPRLAGRRFALDALALVGLVSFIIGSHYGFTYWVPARPAAGGVVAAQLAKPGRDGTLAVSLADGTTLELLALAQDGAKPNSWWRPDGRPVDGTVFDIQGPAVMAGGEDRLRTRLAFRVTGALKATQSAMFESEPASGMSSGGAVWEDGRRIEGGLPMVIAWTQVTNRATVRFGLCTESWRTVVAFDQGESRRTHTYSRSGDPRWLANLNHVSDTGIDTLVTAVLNKERRDWRVRLVAVDVEGREHVYNRANATPMKDSATWTFTFPKLTVDRIKQFRVQAQRVEWVEFRNLPLAFGGAVPELERARVFSAPTSLTLGEVLDLDLGRTTNFPSAPTGGHPIAGMAENLAWALEQGFDVSAGIGEWDLLSVALAPISDEDWQTLTPDLAEARLAAHGSKPRTLKLELGATPAYAFRTRDGGLGMLRVAEIADNGQKFVIQLRHAVLR